MVLLNVGEFDLLIGVCEIKPFKLIIRSLGFQMLPRPPRQGRPPPKGESAFSTQHELEHFENAKMSGRDTMHKSCTVWVGQTKTKQMQS